MKTILLALTLSLCAVLPVSAAQSPESKMRTAEATIRGLPTEHAIIFNSAGDIVARFDAGTADDVRISINGFAGDIMTHNHTLNVSFSTADVDNAREMGLSQLRVVEPITQAKLIPIEGWQETTTISVPQNGRELSAGSQELQSEKA